jgi:2-polyprenyl-3-methyl-5-hydroxy-6-metoxy-1,4-benzoquinol methylase
MTQNLEEQASFYDERWSKFQYAHGPKLIRATAILNALASLRLRTPHMLDLGCGIGWLTGILSQFGPTTGVELSSLAIEEARKRYPLAQFVQADVLNWDHPAKSFDVVISQEVLEHMEDQAKYLDIAADLLKDDGWLILTTPNRKILEAMTPQSRAEVCDQPIEKWLTKQELAHLLDAHFTVIHMSTLVTGFGYYGVHRLVNSIRLVDFFTSLGLRRLYDSMRLSLGFGLHILVVAQRRSAK